jgi:hypothetical protein
MIRCRLHFPMHLHLLCLLVALSAAPMLHAQKSPFIADDDDTDSIYSLHRVDSAGSLIRRTEPLSNCGDSLSAALQQGTPEFPCWANIRTVDRWNSASIGYDISPGGQRTALLPGDIPSSFSFTAGGLSAFSLPGDGEGKAYGGLGAMSGLVARRRWQLMAEDAGGVADFQLSGGHFVGLNLAAVRTTGEITPRFTWQGSATNTYGTDAVRQVAPLDYRMLGGAEIPAPDAPLYGLHNGLMTEGEEGVKLRYENSRRSAWDFSGSHDYTKYNGDGFLVHAARVQAEYLHTLAPGTALGFYGNGGYQTSPLTCSMGGAGLRLLSGWGARSSLTVSGGVDGANPSCGKRVQFTGNLAFYTRLTSRTDIYATANRDLSNGLLEHAVFLSTGGAGIRHAFNRNLDVHASLNEAYGTDPVTKQTYHGEFVDGSLHYHLFLGFSQELELRRFAFSGLPAEAGRTAAVFTLWWSPPQAAQPEPQRIASR